MRAPEIESWIHAHGENSLAPQCARTSHTQVAFRSAAQFSSSSCPFPSASSAGRTPAFGLLEVLSLCLTQVSTSLVVWLALAQNKQANNVSFWDVLVTHELGSSQACTLQATMLCHSSQGGTRLRLLPRCLKMPSISRACTRLVAEVRSCGLPFPLVSRQTGDETPTVAL